MIKNIKKQNKFQKEKYIGIFDSGFGGLNVMRGIIKYLPLYNFIYLGDNARVPYGNRSQETIYEFTKQGVDFLFSNDCELVILACNTASSQALRKIQQNHLIEKYDNKKRVLGVSIPLAEEAVFCNVEYNSKDRRVGVIATEATVASKVFINEIKKLNKKIKVYQEACPLLVPIIEAGDENEKFTEMILKKYLTPLIEKDIDTLILGCTHYSLLKKQIKKILGNKVAILEEDEIVGKKLKLYLENHIDIENKISKNKKRIFYTTDNPLKFNKMGSKFLESKIKSKKIKIN